jgi:hypothetical protein
MLASILSVLLLGCSAPKTNWFLFTLQPESGLWRSRELDYVAIAKAYAREKHVDFKFDGAEVSLHFYQEQGACAVEVYFSGSIGAPSFAVDMDGSGKVLRHYTVSPSNELSGRHA